MVKRALFIAFVATACLSDSDFPQDVTHCAATGDGCICQTSTTTGTLSFCDAPTNGLCCLVPNGATNTCTCSDASNAPLQLHSCTNTSDGCICFTDLTPAKMLSNWKLDSCTKPAGGHCCNVVGQCTCSSATCAAGAEVSNCSGQTVPACDEGGKQLATCTENSVGLNQTKPRSQTYCTYVGGTCECEASTRFPGDDPFFCSAGNCCKDSSFPTSGFCSCDESSTCPAGKVSVVDCI